MAGIEKECYSLYMQYTPVQTMCPRCRSAMSGDAAACAGCGYVSSLTTPSGEWLHFDNDAQHRIRRIESSLGRTMHYEYDSGGRLIRTLDSEGHTDVYTYDEKSQMLTAAHENGVPVLTNLYSNDGYIKSQTVADSGKFQFSYFRGPRNVIQESQITDPHEMLTSFLFGRYGYTQTLPRLSGH